MRLADVIDAYLTRQRSLGRRRASAEIRAEKLVLSPPSPASE